MVRSCVESRIVGFDGAVDIDDAELGVRLIVAVMSVCAAAVVLCCVV